MKKRPKKTGKRSVKGTSQKIVKRTAPGTSGRLENKQPQPPRRAPVSVGRLSETVVNYVLMGGAVEGRFTQDSAILPEVWSAFGQAPDSRVSMLIEPFNDRPAGWVANQLANELNAISKPGLARIAYVDRFVVASLTFQELLAIVLPMTDWWHRHCPADETSTVASPPRRAGRRALPDEALQKIPAEELFDALCRSVLPDMEVRWPPVNCPTDVARVVVLGGLLLLARTRADIEDRINSHSGRRELIEDMYRVLSAEWPHWEDLVRGRPVRQKKALPDLIWLVSLNRSAYPAVQRSVPAIKADAAIRLFAIDCSHLTWAVVDSGIDAEHPAFMTDGKSRVRATYDFTQIRDVLRADRFAGATERTTFISSLATAAQLDVTEVEQLLEKLAADMRLGLAVNWDLVGPLLKRPTGLPPNSDHGTHVAGILAGRWERGPSDVLQGVCPNLQLYDLRVLSATVRDTEFAVIAAMQFIRHLNERSGYTVVHGANISLSIPHDVRNYACGQTPVCAEADRLSSSGVMVIAAAGNQGSHEFQTARGVFLGYSAMSITDPGNADSVVTVGSTHRHRPHTYGVSFFSSRGPTGDGRRKPDLVAPGEKIEAPTPNGRYAFKDGTSMSAPHVSGAAAMIMARHGELIGRPARIKKILCEAATDLGREKDFQGAGMLDVLRALQSV